jgi:hypothetical protein
MRDGSLEKEGALLGDHVDSKNMFFKRVAIDRFSGRILWVGLSFNNN